METEEIKRQITDLAIQHQQAGDELEDVKDSDGIEYDATMLIVDYCQEKGYAIEGFPLDYRNTEDYDRDYYGNDRKQWYVDTLTLTHPDVAELSWHYVSSFWPGQCESKDEFLESVKTSLDMPDLFYDFDF